MGFDFEKFGDKDAFCIAPPDEEFVFNHCEIEHVSKNGDDESATFDVTIVCSIGSMSVECQDRHDPSSVHGSFPSRKVGVNLNQRFTLDVNISYEDYCCFFDAGLFLSGVSIWLLSEYQKKTAIGLSAAALLEDVHRAILEQSQFIFDEYLVAIR